MGLIQEKLRHAQQNKYHFLRAVELSCGNSWFTILPEMLGTVSKTPSKMTSMKPYFKPFHRSVLCVS